jgi:lysophospholipase L1-like esterase
VTRNQRMRTCLRCVGIWALVASVRLAAQPVGVVDDPCPMPFVPSAALQKLVTALLVEPHTITPEELERFNASPELAEVAKANRQRAQDWPGLCRFRAANAAVLAAPTRPRVVFMGDSITENWELADPAFFRGEIVNRGISGQTTPQMLVRFRADVVALAPKIVHIMAGTNDVAGNTGPLAAQDVENNIMSMVDLARVNGIEVVLASIPPAARFSWRPELRPAPTIAQLNGWLRAYAAKQGLRYIDYYSALAGTAGEFPAELSNDGVHPNRKGYAIMRRMAEAALASKAR